MCWRQAGKELVPLKGGIQADVTRQWPASTIFERQLSELGYRNSGAAKGMAAGELPTSGAAPTPCITGAQAGSPLNAVELQNAVL